MKKVFLILVVAFMTLFAKETFSQNLMLNANTHETTVNRCAGYFYDNSSTANYATSVDRWVTICPQTSSPGTRIALTFEEFNLADDQMIIYEGTTLNDPMYVGVDQATSFTGTDLLGRTVMPTLTYGSACLTVRLISNGSNTESGWKAKMECVRNCQFPEASLDTFFYKYDTEGNMTVRPIRESQDTIITESGDTTIIPFKSVDICLGDSV